MSSYSASSLLYFSGEHLQHCDSNMSSSLHEQSSNVLAAQCQSTMKNSQSNDTPSANDVKEITFGVQLKATIRRVILLQRRHCCAYICELLIPIIFIAATAVLYNVLGKEHGEGGQYFDMSEVDIMRKNYVSTRKYMCYNDTMPGVTPIGDLSPCSKPSPDTLDLKCNTDKNDIPLGFCTSSINFFATVLLDSSNKKTILPPRMDDYILMQWATRVLLDNKEAPKYPWAMHESPLSSGQIIFSPDSPEVKTLVDYFTSTYTYFKYIYGGTMSPADAESYAHDKTDEKQPVWTIVNVKNFTSDKFDVEIRPNLSYVPRTADFVEKNYIGGVDGGTSLSYVRSGFVTLQKALYDAYLKNIHTYTAPFDDVVVASMPTISYSASAFVANAGPVISLIITLGFNYPLLQMVRRIVDEKESRRHEAMLIMGVTQKVIYLSWFIIYSVQYLLLSVVCTLIFKLTYLKNSNVIIIFVFMFLFAMTTIALSGLFASFFSKARIAGIVSQLIFIIMAIPLLIVSDAAPAITKGLSVLSPTAVHVGLTLLFTHEATGGLTLSDLNSSLDDPSMLFVLFMLIVDFFLYLILMMYFDAVVPKEWGVAKHPLFFITDPLRKCFRRVGRRGKNTSLADGRDYAGVFEEADDTCASVRIAGLRKEYNGNGNKFTAVNNLYWNIRPNEISVLLGHNGAGKTTTINMITGMTKPTNGDCFVLGKSVRNNLSDVRQLIGYCPQHNILWPELTCREHLEYFGRIKGLREEHLKEVTENILSEVTLLSKIDSPSSTLSGGQKRKLSIAIAFVGRSPLVLLDEPTAGMDVCARRHAWDLLKRMSDKHTILMTTHYMDEADLLGDTIAIVGGGRLKCSGSSVFLKSRLGVGYVLTVSLNAHANTEPILSLIQQHVREAQQLTNASGELTIRLPMEEKSHFAGMLAQIESRGKSLGINAFSLSATTLEEIFLRIADDNRNADTEDDGHVENMNAATRVSDPMMRENVRTPSKCRAIDSPDDGFGSSNTSGDIASNVWDVARLRTPLNNISSQFAMMLKKRCWNALRDRRTQISQIVVPVFCVLVACLLLNVDLWSSLNFVLSSNVYGVPVTIDVANCTTNFDIKTPFSSNAQTWHNDTVTNTNQLSQYLFRTYNNHDYGKARYGSFTCLDTDGTIPIAAILFNTTGTHEIPISMNNLYNGIYRSVSKTTGQMTTSIHTMPMTKSQEFSKTAVSAMVGGSVILIAFVQISGAYIGWIVKERATKSLHLQKVSGLNVYIYWIANYLFDLASYFVAVILMYILFFCFHRQEYTSAQNIGPCLISVILYGLSCVPMTYMISFFFKDSSSAINKLLLINFISGYLLVSLVQMLKLFFSGNAFVKYATWIFRVFPSFCIGEVLLEMPNLMFLQKTDPDTNAWSMSLTGWPCIYMTVEAFVFFLFTVIYDNPFRRKYAKKLINISNESDTIIVDEDSDVERERELVNSEERASDLVKVKNLHKRYSNGLVAVRNLTFGVKPGEVFGFLGTNGAGKTTTISILCQDLYPTSGQAMICGYDVVEQSDNALHCIGYCPQFDATLELLTVEENLMVFAGIRGIVYEKRERVITSLLDLFKLTSYRNTLSKNLSGGNRRKLSVAIGLIGGPRVVFLDEPSAGMDPVSRRGLWNAIETVSDNCSVVLTTHHLEEIEALAHRVAIMIDGSLKCIGTKPHLKRKFGSGFQVTIRLDDGQDHLDMISDFFNKYFTGSKMHETRARRVVYELPRDTVLSKTFAILEQHAANLHIADYAVSETSIEQVFLNVDEYNADDTT